MGVTTPQKTPEPREREPGKKHGTHYYKTRPITATLEHPLILDIKLLKKLDMTTFTKKGLIALSKFCGISLITKTDSKRKFNKCVKLNGSTGEGGGSKKFKRKQRKQTTKPGPRIRFKIAEDDEDAADVICKKHDDVSTTNNRAIKSPGERKLTDRKLMISDIVNATIENAIPEPCKTCCRSEHPERFHSHPKTSTKLNQGQNRNEKNTEKVRNGSEGKKKMEKNSSANQKASSQESLSPDEENLRNDDSSPKLRSASQEPEAKPQSKNLKKLGSEEKSKSGRRTNSKAGEIRESENAADEDPLKYITGCYLCGKQVSPKMRMKHEASCISEWRSQNSLLSPDKRKPEPKRPDFRFTVTGELDCEGTFESIWANHKDSLVPCKKCGRTFFPDRIEKHQSCCNNAPLNIKYKR